MRQSYFQSYFLGVVGLHRFFAVQRSCFARNIKSETLIAAALLSALVVPFTSASGAAQPQVPYGHVPKISKNLSPQGRLDPNRHIQVAIGLPLRNREQLTNLLADVYN